MNERREGKGTEWKFMDKEENGWKGKESWKKKGRKGKMKVNEREKKKSWKK